MIGNGASVDGAGRRRTMGTEAGPIVDAVLRGVGRRVGVVDAAAELLHVSAAAMAGLLVLAVIDQSVEGGLPLAWRLGVAGGGAIVVLVALVARAVRPIVQPVSARYAARLIERRYPRLANVLVTAVDLRRDSGAHPGVVAGLLEYSARRLVLRDMRRAVPRRSLRRAGWAAGAALAAWGGFALVAPKPVLTSLLRVCGMDLAAPTRTRVVWVSPGDDVSVVRGAALRIEVRTEGQQPSGAAAEFSWDTGLTWPEGRRVHLSPAGQWSAGPREWSATVPGIDVQASMLCRVRAGDGTSDVRRIEVRPAPEVTRVSVRYQYPHYTRLAEEVRPSGDIEAVVGTRVELLATCNVPVAGGAVRFESLAGSSVLELQRVTEAESALRASWVVESDAEYRLVVRDRFGAASQRPIRFRQVVRPDLPPQVELSSPAGDLELASNERFALECEAADDFGVSLLEVGYVNGEKAGRIPLMRLDTTWQRQARWRGDLEPGSFGAKAGDTIEWQVLAWDNRESPRGSDGPQVTAGPVRRIRVVGPRSAASQNAKAADAEPAPPQPPRNASGGDDDEEAGEPDRAGASGRWRDESLRRLVERLGGGSSGDHEASGSKGGADEPSAKRDGERAAGKHNEDRAQGQSRDDRGRGQIRAGGAERAQDGPLGRPDGGEATSGGEAGRDRSGAQRGDGGVGQGERRADATENGRRPEPRADGGGAEQPGGNAQSATQGPGREPTGRGGAPGGDGGRPGKEAGDGVGGAGQGKPPAGEGRGGGSGGGATEQDGGDDDASQESVETASGRFGVQGATDDVPFGGPELSRAVDELERQLRDGRVDAELLRDLDWTEADARRFVREYRRAHGRVDAGPRRTRLPRQDALVGGGERDESLRLGSVSSWGIRGGLDEIGPVDARGPAARVEREEDVPQEYRDLLEAYYREMAERR